LTQRSTVEAAKRLPLFTKPALIAWSADDAFFPREDGRRLADTLPNARFEVIQQARTFSMIDQPETLADLIADFAYRDVTRCATDGPLQHPYPVGTDRTQP
jgi:pimeloyl-ACP methyl ester carboxylesterase